MNGVDAASHALSTATHPSLNTSVRLKMCSPFLNTSVAPVYVRPPTASVIENLYSTHCGSNAIFKQN